MNNFIDFSRSLPTYMWMTKDHNHHRGRNAGYLTASEKCMNDSEVKAFTSQRNGARRCRIFS